MKFREQLEVRRRRKHAQYNKLFGFRIWGLLLRFREEVV